MPATVASFAPTTGPGEKPSCTTCTNCFLAKKLEKCSKYHPSRKSEFVLKCPVGYNGCISTFVGSTSIRGCSQAVDNSCSPEKNGIMHCYCSADACNNPSKTLSQPPEALSQKSHTDDYDYSSGYGDDDESQDDDEGGSGGGDDDYPDDYSDTTGRPPPGMVDLSDGGDKNTKHQENINDLEFSEEGADESKTEDDKIVDIKDEGSPPGSGASVIQLNPVSVIAALNSLLLFLRLSASGV